MKKIYVMKTYVIWTKWIMSYSDVGGAITSFQCLFASNKYVKKTLRAPTTECFSLSRISVVTRLYWITDSLIVHYSVPKLFWINDNIWFNDYARSLSPIRLLVIENHSIITMMCIFAVRCIYSHWLFSQKKICIHCLVKGQMVNSSSFVVICPRNIIVGYYLI